MTDHRPVCDLTTGELLLAALTALERDRGLSMQAGNWQIVTHLRDGRIRKTELVQPVSSVRVNVGAHELFERPEEGLGSAA